LGFSHAPIEAELMYWLPPSRVKQSGKATTGGMRAHRSILLVANSLDWVKDGDAWNGVPDNKIYVIDVTLNETES
jgi:hypothetical protein